MGHITIKLAYWSFQIINTLIAGLMVFIPGQFHESLFSNPQAAYEKIGFSSIAVEMVHNIIRGHGAVLLAVSVFIWIAGAKSRFVYLLMGLVCGFSVYAHIMTLLQHLRSNTIVSAIGDFRSMYITIALTATVGLLGLLVYLKWEKWSASSGEKSG